MSRLSKGDPSSYSEPGEILILLSLSSHALFLSKNDLNFCSAFLEIIILENIVTKHVELFWNVDFNKKTISGEAILHFEIVAKEVERIVSMAML